ncbi:MAG: TIGR03790 family protein, partial [Candidatus Omnitrophota bacterium]|nr:TIGR03790 family protein [Candidatus Omnitrophota bacterium]
MKKIMLIKIRLAILLAVATFCTLPMSSSYADGSIVMPDEVLVIVNDDYYDRDGNGKSDSVDVGEYYALKRGIPPENIFHISCSKSESIRVAMDYGELATQILTPLKNYLDTKRVGDTLLKNKIYYIVTTLGIPLRYDLLGDMFGYSPLYNKIEEVYGKSQYYYDRFYGNERFKNIEMRNREIGDPPVYLVTRLDGPTVEIAKGLIDKAIYAEGYVTPFSGTGYIDRYRSFMDDPFSILFDDIASAFIDSGIPVVQIQDIYPGIYYANFKTGDCPDTMYYFGWYNLWRVPMFEWNVGGIGAELQSFTAISIRSTRQGVPIMLHEGITGTLGFVYEPYAHNAFGEVLKYFVIEGFDFAESTHLGNSNPMACRVGDPLYSLWKNLPDKQIDATPPLISDVNVYIDELGVHFYWQTDEVAWGYVEHGKTFLYNQVINDKFYIMNSEKEVGYHPKYYTKRHGIDPFHTFTISQGLLPQTQYHFRIKSIDPAGNVALSGDYTFITPGDTNFQVKAWSPEIALWGYTDSVDVNEDAAGKTVRNYFNVKKFSEGGNKIRFRIQASSTKPLKIMDATIAQAKARSFDFYEFDTSSGVYRKKTYNGEYLNLEQGSLKNVTFNNGVNYVYLNPGESIWCDWIEMEIDVNKRYCISFYIDPINSGIASYVDRTVTGNSTRTMDALAWFFKGNKSNEADWGAIINQETTIYEAIGDFTQAPDYSLTNPYSIKPAWGDYKIYGIDSIETSLDGSVRDGMIWLDKEAYYLSLAAQTYIRIFVIDKDLNIDSSSIDTLTAYVTSEVETILEPVLLTEMSSDSSIFEGSIELRIGNPFPDGVLQINTDDTITAIYYEDSPPETETAIARVDFRKPVAIPGSVNIQYSDIEIDGNTKVTITWQTDEPSSSAVHYGTTTALGQSVSVGKYVKNHSVIIYNP